MNWEQLGEIVNPWQAIVILGILFVPQVLALIQSRQATKILKHEVKPNSGQTLKDSLNRIERTQARHGKLLRAMDGRVTHVEKVVEYFHPEPEGKHKAARRQSKSK